VNEEALAPWGLLRKKKSQARGKSQRKALTTQGQAAAYGSRAVLKYTK